MSDPLKPQFWVLRQNGSIVPLIAMDEMPHNIRVEGVSRTLNIKDTIGMVNIGEHPSRHRVHQVFDINKTSSTFKYMSTKNAESRDLELNEEISAPVIPTMAAFEIHTGSKKSYGIREQPPSDIEEVTENMSTKRAISGNKDNDAFGKFDRLPGWKDTTKLGSRLPAPGKKKYCSHWMSTGECDYAQQGCLYKHEMPFDLELLNYLGFQDIPKWYREKHGIGKLTATPGSGAVASGPSLKPAAMQGSWRIDAGKQPQKQTSPPTGKSLLGTVNMKRQHSKSQGRQNARPNLIDIDQVEEEARRSTDTTKSNALFDSKFATNPRHFGRVTVRHGTPSPFTKPSRPNSGADSISSVSLRDSTPSPFAKSSRPSSAASVLSTTVQAPRSNTSVRTDSTFAHARSIDHGDASTPRSTPFSRRSSVYSDPETDLIKENELRQRAQDEEYNQILAAKKASDERLARNSKEESE